MTWIFFDRINKRKVSALGACIGAVVGLVAITPACGFVSVSESLFIGFISAIVSNIMVNWKALKKIDDTLDVFACHGVGGIMGMILTAILHTVKMQVFFMAELKFLPIIWLHWCWFLFLHFSDHCFCIKLQIVLLL
jgi:ammonia channel protein AmtB